MKICTDIKQSKKLIDMGFPKDSADMFWDLLDGDADEDKIPICMPDRFAIEDNEFIPAWSIDALTNLIPYNVTDNKAVYRFTIKKFPDYWECYHENWGCSSTPITKGNTMLDSLFEMVVWLKENGKI